MAVIEGGTILEGGNIMETTGPVIYHSNGDPSVAPDYPNASNGDLCIDHETDDVYELTAGVWLRRDTQ